MRQWDSNRDIGAEAMSSAGSIGEDEENALALAQGPAERSEGKHPDPMPACRSIPDKILDRLVRQWENGPSSFWSPASLTSGRPSFHRFGSQPQGCVERLTVGTEMAQPNGRARRRAVTTKQRNKIVWSMAGAAFPGGYRALMPGNTSASCTC